MQKILIKPIAWMWLLTILYLSLKPQITMPINFDHIDKLLHLGSYGLATILMSLAYPKINRYKYVIWLFTYSLAIEIAQLFAINRYFEVADLIANLIGIVFATTLIRLIQVAKKPNQ